MKLFINKDIARDSEKSRYWLSGEDALSFSDISMFLDWMDPNDNRIDVELHSCGGSCVEGYAIYDALRTSGKEISCKVVGQCASMATVILLAAPKERRTIYKHAEMLIHSPRYSADEMTGEFTSERLADMAVDLAAEHDKMLSLYVERTGTSREVLEAQMEQGDWFDAEKAVELGFVTAIVPETTAFAGKLNLYNYKLNKMEKKGTVAEAFKRLGQALGVITPDAVGMVVKTATGEELEIEREDGEIQVGDKASPDGEFVMDDGRTIVIQDGVVVEIKEEEKTDEKDEEIEALKAAVETLKERIKSKEEAEILDIVAKAGGKEWLDTVAKSSYKAPSRTNTHGEKVSAIKAKIEEIKARQNKI